MKFFNMVFLIFVFFVSMITINFAYANHQPTLTVTPEIIGDDSTIHVFGKIKERIPNAFLKIDILNLNEDVFPVKEISLGTTYGGSNSYSELIRVYEIVDLKGDYKIRIQYGEHEKTYPFVYTAKPMKLENQSPKHQIENGIIPKDVNCRDNRVLVLRDNNKIACVFENTVEKKNWEILHINSQEKTTTVSSSNCMANMAKSCSAYSGYGYSICMSQVKCR